MEKKTPKSDNKTIKPKGDEKKEKKRRNFRI